MQSEYEEQLAKKEADRKHEIEELKRINLLAIKEKEEEIKKMSKQLEENQFAH